MGHQPCLVQWLRFHAGQRACTTPAGGRPPAGAQPARASGRISRSESASVSAEGGMPVAPSESQHPDDLVCRIQRRKPGAFFGWGRWLRHCCVPLPQSTGWGADLLWLSWACSGPFCCTCSRCGGMRMGGLTLALHRTPPLAGAQRCSLGSAGPLAPAPVGAWCPCGCEGSLASGAPVPPAARLWGGQPGLSPGQGASGVGGSPSPAVCPWAGQLAHVRPRCGRRRCGGSVMAPSPRMDGGLGCCGGASCRCEGPLGLGAHPLPVRQSGPAAHVCRARVCGRGVRALCLWRACPVGGCVPRGWRRRVSRV